MAEIDLAKAKAQRTFDVLNEIHERGLHRQNGWTARYIKAVDHDICVLDSWGL